MRELQHKIDDYRRTQRCARCKLSPNLCLCGSLQALDLPVQFLVIRHRSEGRRTTGTGHYAPLLLRNSQLIEHGVRGLPLNVAPLEQPDTDYYALYPQEDAEYVTPELMPQVPGRNVAFVVLDGSWRKARRMLRRIPQLQDMPRVRLPLEAERLQGPRRAPTREHRFTLDAIVATIACLGFATESQQLTKASREIVRRQMHLRGKISRRRLAPNSDLNSED